MTIRLTSDRAAAVDTEYFWRPIGADTPRGCKLQLINRPHGVAVYGEWHPGASFTHWAPLPRFAIEKPGEQNV